MVDSVKLSVMVSSAAATAGAEGLGITTSMATGKLVADLILHRTPAIPWDAYLPGRKQEAHG